MADLRSNFRLIMEQQIMSLLTVSSGGLPHELDRLNAALDAARLCHLTEARCLTEAEKTDLAERLAVRRDRCFIETALRRTGLPAEFIPQAA